MALVSAVGLIPAVAALVGFAVTPVAASAGASTVVPAAALIPAIIAAALCGALLFPVVLEKGLQTLHRSRLQARVVESGVGRSTLLASLSRRGIAVLRPLASLLLRVKWVREKCVCCERALGVRGYAVTGVSAACELLLAVFGMVALLTLALTGMPFIALCAAFVAVALLCGKAQRTLDTWGARLVAQIPEVLRSLGLCFNTGYSLQQAFEQVARDTPDPLGIELRQANFDIAAGRSIEEALSALEKRTKAGDLRFAIIALEIQHRTGGSLQDLLENAADAVLASADLRRQLSVQTAQARLSAKVVTIMPVVLVAILSLAMEGYLQTFFSSAEGLAILIIALAMEAIGVFAIRGILGVDLG
jgi:tight adherence protein B